MSSETSVEMQSTKNRGKGENVKTVMKRWVLKKKVIENKQTVMWKREMAVKSQENIEKNAQKGYVVCLMVQSSEINFLKSRKQTMAVFYVAQIQNVWSMREM